MVASSAQNLQTLLSGSFNIRKNKTEDRISHVSHGKITLVKLVHFEIYVMSCDSEQISLYCHHIHIKSIDKKIFWSDRIECRYLLKWENLSLKNEEFLNMSLNMRMWEKYKRNDPLVIWHFINTYIELVVLQILLRNIVLARKYSNHTDKYCTQFRYFVYPETKNPNN